MNNYDDIVKQIRADAARIAGDYNSQWAQAAPPAPTGPSFEEYAKGLNYEALDFEGKQSAQKSWLNQHGAGWKAAGADPEKDLQQYAQIQVPKSGGLTNTDWYDLAAQTVNRSFGSMSNVIGNAVGPGTLQDRFAKQGAEYMAAAKVNEANFSESTVDSLKKNARLQSEAAQQHGGENNVPFTKELALTAGELARNPLNFAAQTAGNAVMQAPGYALQAAGGVLTATGAGAGVGIPLIAAGRAYGAVSGAAQTAGEVGQAASDEVMRLKPSQLEKLPTYQDAYTKALNKGVNERDASLAAQRAVASEVMNYGAGLGAGVGAVGGLVSGISGAGKIAENIGKKAVSEFFKRAGIEFATEGVEGYATKVAENVAARSGGSDTSLTRGAAGSALQEAAGGLTQAGGAAAVGKAVSTVSDAIKGGSTIERTEAPATTAAEAKASLAERMADMPGYVRDFANDLVDTVIANPNPTAAVAADIAEAKAQLVQFGFTQQDLDGLYAAEVKADAPVAPADVKLGTYKPSETGGAPNTDAPVRLVSELAAAGPLTIEGVNQVAVDHEKGYGEWVETTQSQPSRIPSQQFISGTADNMVLTALANNVPMTPELKAYADNLAVTKNQASIDTDRNNMGSRLMADGKSLMTESDYQASQMGRGKDLVGKYVLYGNAEGYVVERPNGLYVVDNRPGNTQDIFIEGGESEETPAQLGLKLMTPPRVSVPQQRQGAGATPAGLVAEAQLNYEQIILNDALDMLVVSMPAAEAEALLTQFDKFLETGTPAQLAQEIENEINKYFAGTSNQSATPNDGATQPAPPVASINATEPESAGGQAGGTTTFGEAAQRTEAVRSRLETWVTSLDPSLKGKTLAQMLPDVTVHDQLPTWVMRDLRARVYTDGAPMQDRTGEPTNDLSQALVGGARRPPLTVDNVVTRVGRTHIFANNMADYQDPIGILLHETWHKYQNRENVDQLRKSVEAWAKMPTDSNEYKAWVAGNGAENRPNGSGGPQEFIPHALQELWELGVRPTDKTRTGTWMQRALDHVRAMINRFMGRAPKLTAEDLMSIVAKLVQTDATGRARESKQFLSDKEQTRGVEPTADYSVADISKLTDKGRSLKEFSQQFAGDIKQKDTKVEDADKIALDYFDKVINDPSTVLPKVEGSTLSYQQYLKMPDGLTYDPGNIDHITATDLTKSIYAAVKSGRIGSALEAEANATNKSRAEDLKSLAKYLKVSQDYVPTEAAVILRAASKWGMRLTTNNDKSEVQLVEITNKNATAIAVLNGLDASVLAEQMKQGKPLKVAFKDALQSTVDSREKAAQSSGKEGWIVYKKSDKYEDHVALRDGCAGREWCTAGAVSTAASQLKRGDFHVFYKKGEPIVALRTVNGRLDEAPRGSLSGQALTPFEREVAERRLRGQPEPTAAVPTTGKATVTGGDAFLEDQKVLADIQSGAIKDYSDVDLWILSEYKFRAADYATNELTPVMLGAIRDAQQARRSTVAWNKMGYYDSGAIDTLAPEELAAVRVVKGPLVLGASKSINFTNLEYAAAIDIAKGGDYQFPVLQKVGTLITNFSSTASVDLPSLVEVTGHAYLAAASASVNAPKLKTIARYGGGADAEASTIGVHLPSLESVGDPATDDTFLSLYNGASVPKLKPTAVVMVHGQKVYAPLLNANDVNFDFLYDDGYDGPEPDLKKNFDVPPFRGAAPTAQPLISGGETFLDDQKVLADIQSGAIKDYSDHALFILQEYTLKAGDYTGDALPDAAVKIVLNVVNGRGTVEDWQAKGFYNTADIKDYASAFRTARVIIGNSTEMLKAIGAQGGIFEAPELVDLHTKRSGEPITPTVIAPKLVRARNLKVGSRSVVPNLQEVSRLGIASGANIPKLSKFDSIFMLVSPKTNGVYPYVQALSGETILLENYASDKSYDLRAMFPNAELSGDMQYSGSVGERVVETVIKEFGNPGRAPAPLPSAASVVAAALATTPTSETTVTGGDAFLDDQKVLADIQSAAIRKYSDADLWMLQGYRLKAGDYTGDSLPEAARARLADVVAARYTPQAWKDLGYYAGASAESKGEIDYPEDMKGVKYVSGAVNVMSDNHAAVLTAPDLLEAGSVYIGYHGSVVVQAAFPKLTKVHGEVAYLGGSLDLYFPALTEVVGRWALASGAHHDFGISAPKLESIGGVEDPEGLSEISTSLPSLRHAEYAHLYRGADLPNLVTGTVGPQRSMYNISIPKMPLENITKEWLDDDEDADFSISDYNPLKRKESKNLADRLKVIEQGKIDSDIPTWQFIKDWTARKLVDVTRPFDVWTRGFGTTAEQAKLVQDKGIAKTRTSSLLSNVDMKYTAPLSNALKAIVSKNHAADVLTAKELVGTWMTVRYAPIQNAEFLKRDQEAVDAAEAAFVEAGGNMVGLRAELQAVTTTRPSQSKLTMRSDAAARRFGRASEKTKSAAHALAKAITEQEERFDAVNSTNDNLDPNVDKQAAGLAGGYNNATAARVLALIEKRVPLAMLEAAAKPVYEMLDFKSKLDLRNGKVALSAHTAWLKHKHYVPLTGDPRSDDSTSDVFGTGSVNQGKDKKAEGRTSSLAQNGIDAAFEQMGKSAQYHGWLPFKQSLTATYERMLREEGTDAKVYEKYGIKRHRENTMSNLSESIVVRMGADVTRNGGGWVYSLNSQAAIDGLKGATQEQAPGWLKPIGVGTMIVGRFITAYTGGFAVINALRDGPERFTNLATRTVANYPKLNMNAVATKAAAYWANPATLTATRQVVAERYKSFDFLEGSGKALPANKADVEMLREMLDAGASSTTGAYLSRDTSELADKLVKITSGTTKVHNALVIWNDSFELKAPFAMYKALRTSGVDANTAAAVTLDTMNFGKSGEAMSPIKALYMFAQPTMTGAHQLAMTLGTTKGKAIAIAVATLAAGVYSLAAAGGGEDPTTKRKRIDALSPELLGRNIPIIIGGDVYKIPVPFGLYQLAWASVVNANRYMDGTYTGWETLGEFAKLGTKTFSPVAPSDSGISKDAPTWFIQTVTPTVLKPVANIATNTGAFGQTLTNEASYKPGTAKWKTARKTTPEAYTEASKYMLDTFGLNIFPETLQESTKLFSYGLVKDLIVDPFVTNPDKDAKGIPRANPLLSRWVGMQTEKSIIDSAYYDIKDDITELRLRKDGAPRGQSPLTQKEIQLDQALKQSETQESGVRKQWNELRKLENEKRISGEAYKERFQQLSRQELEIHKRFIMRYNELNK